MHRQLDRSRWLVLGLVAALLAMLPVAHGAHKDFVIVHPGDTQGWDVVYYDGVFRVENPQGTLRGSDGAFRNGPGDPPVGLGSFEFDVEGPDADTGFQGDKVFLQTESFNGLALADIAALEYSTYRTSGGTSNAPYLNLRVDTSGNGSADLTLAFDVADNLGGTPIADGTWRVWDAAASGAKWWTGSPSNTMTLDDFIGANPGAALATNTAAFRIVAGSTSGWADFVGSVGHLLLNGTIYDFGNTDRSDTFGADIADGGDGFVNAAEAADGVDVSWSTDSSDADSVEWQLQDADGVVPGDCGPFASSATTGDATIPSGCLDALGQGEFHLLVRFLSGGGSLLGEASDASTLDTIAPDAPEITAPDDGSTLISTPVVVEGTAEGGTSLSVLEGATELGSTTVAGDGTWSVSLNLTDGDYTITATSTDAAGNESDPAGEVGFTVLATAPGSGSVELQTEDGYVNAQDIADEVEYPAIWDAPSEGSPTSASVWFETEAGDIPSGCGPWTVAPSGTGSLNATCAANLPEGEFSFKGQWTDGANLSPVASDSAIKDTVAPATPVIVSPGEGALLNTLEVTVSGTGEDGSTVRVALRGHGVQGFVPVEGGTWSLDIVVPEDGEHEVRARAQDEAGNLSPWSPWRAFVVDTEAPDAPTVAFEDDDGVITHFEATAVFLGGTAEPGLHVDLVIRDTDEGTEDVEGSATADEAGDWRAGPFDLSGLADGTLVATAVAVSEAGNVSPEATASIRKAPTADVEVLTPSVEIHDGARGRVTGLDEDVDPEAVEITVVHRGPSEAADGSLVITDEHGGSVEVEIEETLVRDEAVTFEVDLTGLGDGRLTATATAAAEGDEASGVDTTLLDLSPPTSVFTTNDGAMFFGGRLPFFGGGHNINIQGTSTDAASRIISVRLDFHNLDNGTRFSRNARISGSGTTVNWSWSNHLSFGEWRITATAMDEVGHWETQGDTIQVMVYSFG